MSDEEEFFLIIENEDPFDKLEQEIQEMEDKMFLNKHPIENNYLRENNQYVNLQQSNEKQTSQRKQEFLKVVQSSFEIMQRRFEEMTQKFEQIQTTMNKENDLQLPTVITLPKETVISYQVKKPIQSVSKYNAQSLIFGKSTKQLQTPMKIIQTPMRITQTPMREAKGLQIHSKQIKKVSMTTQKCAPITKILWK